MSTVVCVFDPAGLLVGCLQSVLVSEKAWSHPIFGARALARAVIGSVCRSILRSSARWNLSLVHPQSGPLQWYCKASPHQQLSILPLLQSLRRLLLKNAIVPAANARHIITKL